MSRAVNRCHNENNMAAEREMKMKEGTTATQKEETPPGKHLPLRATNTTTIRVTCVVLRDQGRP